MIRYYLSIILGFTFGFPLAQPSKEIISELKFRSIGPAFMTGRISDIVKDPANPSTWYVSVASGNVWKTTNNGTTWKPVFDDYPVYSTGCLAIDPNNPSVIWLGTGENQSQRSVGWGDGIYRSKDGGQTWKNMGLQHSEHIGKILIDPRDSDVILAAAQGPLWRPGGERGIYKSINGGQSWTPVLTISENTGVADLAFDPSNPDVVYATSYQRRRHVGILVAGGQESRIYKSTDNGSSWEMLTKGLPKGDVGRIAIAVSPQKSNVVYAAISSDESQGGFYRSEDYGESWTKQSSYQVVDPQYYGEIYCHPSRFDHVYAVYMMMHTTTDGGKSFNRVNSRFKHVDNHAIVFDPEDSDYMMVGCDGGIYETWDNAESWRFIDNLPIVQFYRVGVDNDLPFYNVYGGTQDNSTLGGPSRTTSRQGITNHDWTLVRGGDGFQSRIDPEDPNTIYAQSQYAGIVRYDRTTGTRIDIRPRTGLDDEPLRWHWDSPLIISPHNPKRLYFAAQKLFRSEDRGDSWKLISPDLSRGEDRNQRQVMGQIWQPEAVWKNVFTSPYGTIVSLNESSISEGLIVAGTDDGQIQVTTDGGTNWTLHNKFQDIPEKCYVADVITSYHDKNTIYAVLNNHKEGDFRPYIIRSTNLGNTWQLISNGIPTNHTGWTIIEDHKEKDLLFYGSEFGLWCSIDGGSSWNQMKAGLPTIAVRDIEVQKREDDLVLATFGRGFYILDDYSVLRKIVQSQISSNTLFDIKKAWIFNVKGNLGYSSKGVFGSGFYTADNPEYGARVRVYITDIKESHKKKRDLSKYPTYEQLKAEDTELKPKLLIAITDQEDQLISTVELANRKGFQEINWELDSWVYNKSGNRQQVNGGVKAGTYNTQVVSVYNGESSAVTNKKSFEVQHLVLSDEKPAEDYHEFSYRVAAVILEVQDFGNELDKELELTEKLLKQSIDPETIKSHELKRKQLLELQYELLDDPTLQKRSEYRLPGVASRMNNVNWRGNTWQITKTQRDQFDLAKSEFEKLKVRFEEIK